MAPSTRDRNTTRTQRAERRIPAFKTVEEEAAFWDSHDSAAFPDEFVDVSDVRFVKAPSKKGITVRLDQDTLTALTQRAKEKGIGPSTLARMWILEHLRNTETEPPGAKV